MRPFVLALGVTAIACGGQIDPTATITVDGGSTTAPVACNALPIPLNADESVVGGMAPFYGHPSFVGVPVPDGRYHLILRRVWQPPDIEAPKYPGPIAVLLEVRGDTWDWVEDDAGTVRRLTFVVTEEEGRYLRLTPRCGGGDSRRFGAIREDVILSLYDFVPSSGGIAVPVQLAFLRQQ